MEINEVNPDGNVYQLKDATARTEIAQIKAQNIYSTEEANTGKKWIDGKPIYRKVCTGRYSTAAQTTTNLVPIANFSNVKNVIDIRGIQQETENRYAVIPNFVSSLEWNSASTGGGIQIFSTLARTNCPFIICIEYTKTTD